MKPTPACPGLTALGVILLVSFGAGCATAPKAWPPYDELAEQSYEDALIGPDQVAALKAAFLETPDFDQRVRALTLLENQVDTATEEPLRLGSIGSAILDHYRASLVGHQALAKFYRHVGSLAQAATHDAWVEAIRAAIPATGADGTIERPYPVLSANEARAFVASRGQVSIGSTYDQTDDHALLLWLAAREPEGRPVDVFFDLGDLYAAIASSVERNPSTVFPAGPPETCESLGLCDDFNPWALIKVLAHGNDSAAQTFIGWKLALMDSLDEAESWLLYGARAANQLANNLLAEVYWRMSVARDSDAPENRARAERRFKLAIDAGLDTAMFNLARLYIWGLYGEERVADGVRLVHRAAELDNTDALVYLGWRHVEGALVPKDHDLADGYFVRAAEQDDYAKVEYARFLLHPEVTHGFNKQAYRWLRDIAEAENAFAMLTMGDLYAKGVHVGRSFRRAASWFKNAVEAAPDDPRLVNEVAWRLTTTHMTKLRNPRYALEIMERVMEESETARRTPQYLDTWAAAYAATGDFERAVTVQKEAVQQAMSDDDGDLPILLEHLEEFRAGREISDQVP